MEIIMVVNVSEIASGCVRKGGQPKRIRCDNGLPAESRINDTKNHDLVKSNATCTGSP